MKKLIWLPVLFIGLQASAIQFGKATKPVMSSYARATSYCGEVIRIGYYIDCFTYFDQAASGGKSTLV